MSRVPVPAGLLYEVLGGVLGMTRSALEERLRASDGTLGEELSAKIVARLESELSPGSKKAPLLMKLAPALFAPPVQPPSVSAAIQANFSLPATLDLLSVVGRGELPAPRDGE